MDSTAWLLVTSSTSQVSIDKGREDIQKTNQRAVDSSGVVIRGFIFNIMVLAAVRMAMQIIEDVDKSARVLHSLGTWLGISTPTG